MNTALDRPAPEHPRDQLDVHAMGGLSAPERRRVEAHLRDCATCRTDLAAWQALATAAREAVDVPPVTAGELDRLRRRLEDARRPAIVDAPTGAGPSALGAELSPLPGAGPSALPGAGPSALPAAGPSPLPAAAPSAPRRARRPLMRRPLARRLVLTAAASAVLAVGITAGLLPEGTGGAEPAAAAVLDRAAAAAAAAPAVRTADGTVWFTEARHEDLGLDIATDRTTGQVADRSFLVQRRFTTRVWLALPDRQRYDQDAEQPVVAPGDRAAWIAAGRPKITGPASFTDDPGTSDTWQLLLDDQLGAAGASLRREVDLLRSLPTDPDDLGGWLRDRVRDDVPGRSLVQWCPVDAGSCSEDAKVFQAAAALLAAPVAPPALRSALYRVVAALPGVRLDGAVTDGAGRAATQVSTTTGHLRYELLFDPDNATLLATRQVLVTPQAASEPDPQWTGAAPGSVVRSVLYLRSQVVGSIGATS